MARTTNADTLPYVDSRYELGMLAAQRVRDLNGGAAPVVERDDDKLTVLALREIASGKLNIENIRHEFVQSYKDAPTVAEDSLEVAGEDPVLREIDAELESALLDDTNANDAASVMEDASVSADAGDAE